MNWRRAAICRTKMKQKRHSWHGEIRQNQNRRSRQSLRLRLDRARPRRFLDVTPRPIFIPDFATPRFRLTPRHFAYLKIAEGCNHPCSFCIIPRMRGSHRSRTQSDIVAEAKALLADGVKELNLISQDSTYYGLDLRRPDSTTPRAPFRRRKNSPPR